MLCCRGLNTVIHISKHNSHSCWMGLFQMQDMWDCACAIINQVSFNFKIRFPCFLWPCQWGEPNPAALCLCLFLGWVSKHFCRILFQELLDTRNKFFPSAVVIFASFDLKMTNWHEWHKRVTVKSFNAQVTVLSLTLFNSIIFLVAFMMMLDSTVAYCCECWGHGSLSQEQMWPVTVVSHSFNWEQWAEAPQMELSTSHLHFAHEVCFVLACLNIE
jgi:hypothetical protein